MNTNPSAITVLCYGDSNTWGQKPDDKSRYAVDVRWTGLLQETLGSEYYIIEEGLSSRTTDLEYDRKPGRNGKTYLAPCLASHNPLDIVVIMLGTNDLKIEFHRSAEDIAHALEDMVQDIREYGIDKSGVAPKVLLVSPIHIDDTARYFKELYTGSYDERGARESRRLAGVLSNLAQSIGCVCIDASLVAEPGVDGIHMSEASQLPFAELLKKNINLL